MMIRVIVFILFVVIFVAIGLAAMALSFRYQVAAESGQEPQLYRGVPLDAHLLLLDKRALEEAYVQHGIRLWNVWLSDGARSADRITTGLRIARQSYHQAAGQIAKRERELDQK